MILVETPILDLRTSSTPVLALETAPVEVVRPIECSCVRYAKSLAPNIPLFDAIDYPINTVNPKVGDIIKLQYYNEKTGNYVYHVGVLTDTTDTYTFKQGNKPKCATSTETIAKDNENILGFFDVQLWDEIMKLTKEQRDVLQCESNFSHYNTKQTYLIGGVGEIGIAQFRKQTWNWMEDHRRVNKEHEILLDIYDPYDQIKQFKYMWNLGYKDHWYAIESDCFKRLQ